MANKIRLAFMLLRYLRYGLIGLWVSFLAPLLFERLKIAKIKPVA